ncbi:hypothetical protein AB0C13_40010 [Streptomyces sp. NPDC049099]|uniref:hypothetical protein n=1 Tax=Streptomyces sp. NPDC049099 TaxID=3155768 RepID=UPI0034373D9E
MNITPPSRRQAMEEEIAVAARDFDGVMFGLRGKDPAGTLSQQENGIYETFFIKYDLDGRGMGVGTTTLHVDPLFAYRWIATFVKNRQPQDPTPRRVDLKVGHDEVGLPGDIPSRLQAYRLGSVSALSAEVDYLAWIAIGDLDLICAQWTEIRSLS